MKINNDTAAILAMAIFLVGLALGSWIGYNEGVQRTMEQLEESLMEEDASGDTLSERDVLILAIAKTESDFDFNARGGSNDYGVFQLTPIFVKEANRIIGEEVYKHSDAFEPKKALEMVTIVQDHRNPTHDTATAIALHNPRGNAIGYADKVKGNMDWVKRYEEIRTLIKRQ